MSVDRDTHRTFLTDNGASEEMVDRTMSLMEPFFVNAENGSYPLMSKEALEAEGYGPRFAEAIAKATGKEVEKIIFVSLEHPFPKPEGMSKETYRNSLWFIFEDSIGNSLWEDSIGNSLWSSIRASLSNNPRNNLGNSRVYSLQTRLGRSLWDSLENRLDRGVCDSLGSSLWCLSVFALCNDKEKFERIAQLLELMVRGLAVSNLKHAPLTWVVLCK